jgi:hypothetical protein
MERNSYTKLKWQEKMMPLILDQCVRQCQCQFAKPSRSSVALCGSRSHSLHLTVSFPLSRCVSVFPSLSLPHSLSFSLPRSLAPLCSLPLSNAIPGGVPPPSPSMTPSCFSPYLFPHLPLPPLLSLSFFGVTSDESSRHPGPVDPALAAMTPACRPRVLTPATYNPHLHNLAHACFCGRASVRV